MDTQVFLRVTPLAAGALFFVAVLTVLLAFWSLRRGRRDATWMFRRAATQRGGRLLMLGLFMMFMSGLICGSNMVIAYVVKRNETPTAVVFLDPTETPTPRFSSTPSPSLTLTTTLTPTILIPTSAPLATDLPTETPTLTPTQTLTPSHTPTRDPLATLAPTDPPSPSPTATATPLPTETPLPTATPEVRLPIVATIQSNVTPPANARLLITALDTQISGASSPITANTAFSAGFNRIYYFVTYTSMGPGMLWRGTLSHDGAVINRFERQWGTAVNGATYFFFASESGFQPGEYEIKLYFGVSETPAAVTNFKVIPAK